jgi:lysophospholipase L1-like esterase
MKIKIPGDYPIAIYPAGGRSIYVPGGGDAVEVFQSGISWLLRDEFTTVLAEKGTEVLVDTEGKLSKSGGLLVCSGGKTSAAWGDPQAGFLEYLAKAPGRLMIGQINIGNFTSKYVDVGWQNQTSPAAGYSLTFFSSAYGLNTAIAGALGNLLPVGRSYAISTDYKVCVPLRHSGAQYLIKGGALYPNWTLVKTSNKWFGIISTNQNFMPRICNHSSPFTSEIIGAPDFNWLACPAVSDDFVYKNFSVPVPASGLQVAFIGDSVIWGGSAPGGEISTHFNQIVGCTVLNKGVGSETSTQIAARFAADIVAAAPYYVAIEAGPNDFAASISKATFLSNWTNMLDQCVAAGIKPICMLIPPMTSMSAYHAAMVDYNTDLATLVGTYSGSGALLVDTANVLGSFRTGDPAGSLMDLKPKYDSGDGFHPNSAGYRRMAQAIIGSINPVDTELSITSGEGHYEGCAKSVGQGGSGIAWTVHSGVSAIVNGCATFSTAGEASLLSPTADVNLRCKITLPASGTTSGGLTLRYTDADNYWYIKITPGTAGNDFFLIERNAGTETTRANADIDWVAGKQYQIEVSVRGSTEWRVFVDDINKLNYTTSNTFSETVKRFGLKDEGDSNLMFKDFVITPVGTSGEHNALDRF